MKPLLAALAAFVLTAATGEPVKLRPLDEAAYQKLVASHKGKVVLVDFWATWCAPCREELPKLVKLEAALSAKGFRLVTISTDDPEQEQDAVAFLEKHGSRMPGYVKRPRNDDKFIRFIDGKWSGALPALFLYDRQGNKVASFVGETEMADLEKAIRKIL